MIADRSVFAVIAPLHSRCSVCLDLCRYNPTCEKIVKWLIVQLCGKYEQWEPIGTAEIAEFAGLQTRQEERYVISLFSILLGESFMSFSWRLRWPFLLYPWKIGPVHLFGHVRLNRLIFHMQNITKGYNSGYFLPCRRTLRLGHPQWYSSLAHAASARRTSGTWELGWHWRARPRNCPHLYRSSTVLCGQTSTQGHNHPRKG